MDMRTEDRDTVNRGEFAAGLYILMYQGLKLIAAIVHFAVARDRVILGGSSFGTVRNITWICSLVVYVALAIYLIGNWSRKAIALFSAAIVGLIYAPMSSL